MLVFCGTKGVEVNKKRFLVMSLAAATFALIGTVSVALADPTSSHSGGANANQIGVVRIVPNDPSVADVTGRYTWPASPGPAHLFVSVKQEAGGRPDSALKLEGSSSLTYPDEGWLERHPGPDARASYWVESETEEVRLRRAAPACCDGRLAVPPVAAACQL